LVVPEVLLLKPRARIPLWCLGVLQLVLVAVGVRAALYSFARLAQEDAFNPLWAIREAPQEYRHLLVIGTTLELGAIGLAFTSGLGLLGLRPWAWWATVAFCAVRIAAVSVQAGNFYFNILKRHLQGLEDVAHSQVPAVLRVQPIVPFALGLAYPTLLLAGLLVTRTRLFSAEKGELEGARGRRTRV